jgi:hypothetical protein
MCHSAVSELVAMGMSMANEPTAGVLRVVLDRPSSGMKLNTA